MPSMKRIIPLTALATALLLRCASAEPVVSPVVVGDLLQVTIFAGGEKLTTALLDRLAHHATVITTKGKSYRMRKRRGPG